MKVIDPNIYINKDSELWNEKIEDEQFDYRYHAPTIKLENENEILKRYGPGLINLIQWPKEAETITYLY